MMPKNFKTDDIINGIVKMKVEKGASNKTILDFLQDDLGYKQTYSYELLGLARKRIQEIWDKNAEAHLEEAKGQLEDMLENSIRQKNMKLALDIRKEINKLMGLYAAEKIDITSGGKEITEIKLIQIKSKDDLKDERTDDKTDTSI
jgi:hypothetical protein